MDTDVLSDVLRSLRAVGTVYFCDQLKPPWVKEYSGTGEASFHQIRRGSCWLIADGVELHLGPGDFVFIEPDKPHKIVSELPGAKEVNTNPATLLLCGYCQFDDALALPLSALFPDISVIREEQLQSHAQLRTLLDNLSGEYLSNRPGTKLVVNKLTEVLLVELIRVNFGQREDGPLLKALADKRIAQALHLLHQNPEKPWALNSLASDVGMSRAAFAKQFKTLVEHSMFDYLTQLRLQRACELLEITGLSLYEIANRVGYESDLSFTRTFKKRLGITPTAYRKHKRNDENLSQGDVAGQL